jgi:hypothetical protein
MRSILYVIAADPGLDFWLLCLLSRLSDSHPPGIRSNLNPDFAYTWPGLNDIHKAFANGLVDNPFFLCIAEKPVGKSSS